MPKHSHLARQGRAGTPVLAHGSQGPDEAHGGIRRPCPACWDQTQAPRTTAPTKPLVARALTLVNIEVPTAAETLVAKPDHW